MLLKLKVKEKEATKNIPPGPPGSLNAGERGQGRRRGAGWREEGTREAPEGGVGGDGGSVSPLSPPPPRAAPLSWRLGSAQSPILQNPGWGREWSWSARLPARVSGRRGRSPEVHGGWGKG